MTPSDEPRLPYAVPNLESLGSIEQLTQAGGIPTDGPDGPNSYGPGLAPGS
jgi:hypothetical protein